MYIYIFPRTPFTHIALKCAPGGHSPMNIIILACFLRATSFFLFARELILPTTRCYDESRSHANYTRVKHRTAHNTTLVWIPVIFTRHLEISSLGEKKKKKKNRRRHTYSRSNVFTVRRQINGATR